MKKKLLLPLIALGLVLCTLWWPTSLPGAKQPNFVVFIADDLGWNDIGTYGNPFVHTPNIDVLAVNGLRFDNAFLTTSSCSASRASILTGKYPHSNGLVHLHESLPKGEFTIARKLRESGYYTASIGKWHLGGPAKHDFNLVLEEDRPDMGKGWFTALQNRPRDKPFFFWFAAHDPHRPHDAPGIPGQDYRPRDIQVPGRFFDGPKTRSELRDYYREVTRFDRHIGLVLHTLVQEDLLENTVIIVMSDNGRPFHRAKLTLYDDGIKTPFIIHWPRKISEPGIRDQLISAVDIAPTILEWAGLPVPEDIQGVSFAQMMADPDYSIRDYIYAERNGHTFMSYERAVRSTSYLYKENRFPLSGDCTSGNYSDTAPLKEYKAAFRRGELPASDASCFDEVRDTFELLEISEGIPQGENRVNDEAYAAILESLRDRLQRWRTDTGDFEYHPAE